MRDTDLCVCGDTRERHIEGLHCMGARMAAFCFHRCVRFVRDEKATREYNDWQAKVLLQHKRIAKAKSYIDEGAEAGGWLPSELLTIGYSILVTGPNPQNADIFLDDMLETARTLFRQGKPANPFSRAVSQPADGVPL